ncbi:MAG: YabP/YqfC family sporulation protein, partial [Clostridia bacterium]|nr:YabP/YqfC family sporulation protein [Clostridia bacterium]
AQTGDGRLHIKGEGLYIENLNADTGELLVKGRVLALSYADGVHPTTLLGRIFK